MIPDFDENGKLRPGIHVADIEAVYRRSGVGSDLRQAEAGRLARPKAPDHSLYCEPVDRSTMGLVRPK